MTKRIYQQKPKSKYGNRKITDPETGEVFDSVKEYSRWKELLLLERAGEIERLQRQVTYVLIPPFTDEEGHKERSVTYTADFIYCIGTDLVVEDVKSPVTRKEPAYRIKKKMMSYFYGIVIKEV